MSCTWFASHGGSPSTLRPPTLFSSLGAAQPLEFRSGCRTGGTNHTGTRSFAPWQVSLQVLLVASRMLSRCPLPAWTTARLSRCSARRDGRNLSSMLRIGTHFTHVADLVLLSFGSAWRGGPCHGSRGGRWTELSLQTGKSLEVLTASRTVAPSLGGQVSCPR